MNYAKPFIVDKNLGAALDIENTSLPDTTSDGTAVVPPTQEQKYLFDMRGWLLVPGVLKGDELEEMQEFCHRLRHEPESIPEHQRSPLGGPMEKLSDHPNVVGFLNEFLAHPALSSHRMLRLPNGIVQPILPHCWRWKLWTAQRQRYAPFSRRFTSLSVYPRQSL